MYRYREVYSDIKKNILTNHFRAGQPLPTQDNLAAHYGVSRITLKKAINMLVSDGLVYSKQGSGTYVRPRMAGTSDELLPLDSPIGVTYSHRDQEIKSELRHFGARLPNETEQRNLGVKANEPVYEIKRVRYVNGHHYSYEHTMMPTDLVELDEKILAGSVYDYLGSKGIQLVDARRIIFAGKADEETAAALDIPVGEAILNIEQTAYDQEGRAFEYSVSKFRYNNSKFVVDVHRQIPDDYLPH